MALARQFQRGIQAQLRVLQNGNLDDLRDEALAFAVKDLYYKYESVEIRTRPEALLFLEFAKALGKKPAIEPNETDYGTQKNAEILTEDLEPDPSAPDDDPSSFKIRFNDNELNLSTFDVTILKAFTPKGPYDLYLRIVEYEREIQAGRIVNIVIEVGESTFNQIKVILES